ncbi:MAG: type II secretion system secretin GspD [Sulfurovum sp.]|nr:type II secretion system secretin GspD [Sulfurovum sp.]
MKLIKSLLVVMLIVTTVWSSEEDTVDLNLRNMSVRDFIEMVSKVTHKNILIDTKLKGKINFISQKPIKKSSLIPFANSILGNIGLTLIDQGDFYKVVKGSIAAGEGLDVSSSIKGDTMKTVIFPLKNSNAAVIRAKIKPLLNRNDKVISFKENNVLAITATPRTLKSLSKFINVLERRGVKHSRVIHLEHSSVKDLFSNAQNMAKRLFPQTIESEKVDIFKDAATNSIILVGKEENIQRMIGYIDQLDIEGEDQTQKMYVIRLENSNVEEMEKILSKLIMQMNNIRIKQTKRGAKIPSKAMVVSDVERNALIVLATGEQIKNIRETVRKIDIPKTQVYVKARIVEIDKNLAEQVGAKYNINGGSITSNGLYTLTGNMGAASALQISPALLAFLNTNSKSAFTDSNGNVVEESNPAFKFSDTNEVFALGAQLDFLRKNGAAHILSEPSILCTNNKEAEIYVGQTRSILTQARQSTQGSSPVVNSYNREDIGLTLKVKPRLSSNDKVTLEVETTIEDVLDTESPNADRPTTTKRNVKTTAIVNNGEMIILGGLIKNTGGRGTARLPILGDIPVLGEIFNHTSDVTRVTNVVIYLTPYIVRRSDELKELKRHLDKLDQIQAEYSKLVGKALEKRAEGGAEEGLAGDIKIDVPLPPSAASQRIRHKPQAVSHKNSSTSNKVLEAF